MEYQYCAEIKIFKKKCFYLWWFKGIISGEMYRKKKNTPMIRTVILKNKNSYYSIFYYLNVQNNCVLIIPLTVMNNTRVGEPIWAQYVKEKGERVNIKLYCLKIQNQLAFRKKYIKEKNLEKAHRSWYGRLPVKH